MNESANKSMIREKSYVKANEALQKATLTGYSDRLQDLSRSIGESTRRLAHGLSKMSPLPGRSEECCGPECEPDNLFEVLDRQLNHLSQLDSDLVALSNHLEEII